MHRFLAELIFLIMVVSACSYEKERVSQKHLHNYPFLEDCPSIKEKAIDNEEELKAQAKALNMRYVDYLHYLTNKDSEPNFPLKKSNNALTTSEQFFSVVVL